MESALDAFQGRVARRITGRQPQQGRDGRWYYSSLTGALKEAGVVRIRTSILRRQNTVAQFIATRPILGLCEVTERRPGTRVPRRWREQTGIHWKAARAVAEAAAAKNREYAAMAGEPELTGSYSEPKTTAQGGTAGGTREEASLGASGSSGAGRRTELSGKDTKSMNHIVYYKSIKGQSLEFIIAAALGLELHHPIMSKLWGLGDQTYRQT